MNPNDLRQRTRSEHEAVEACMPVMQESLTRDEYIHVLRCLYPVVNAWERWALDSAPAKFLPLVQARQRTALLAEDLRFFGRQPPSDTAPVAPVLDRLAEATDSGSSAYDAVFLGAMYVMEGSTLGGQQIARHVEHVLGLVPGEGDGYFRGYGDRTGPMWMEFKRHLSALHDSETDRAVEAARAMFDAFGKSLRTCLPI